MLPPRNKPTVTLHTTGRDMGIISRTRRALFCEGADMEYVSEYVKKAMSEDYTHCIKVTKQFVTVCEV
jgi:hypothetical protein